MRTRTDTQVTRRNLTLRTREVSSLDALRVQTEAQSDSEVVRVALRYYQQYTNDRTNGRSLFVVRSNDERYRIVIETGKDLTTGEFVRRNLLLHELSMQRLELLRDTTGAASDSQVIRQALNLYEILVNESSDGSRFFVGREENLQEIILGSLASSNTPMRPLERAKNGAELVIPT